MLKNYLISDKSLIKGNPISRLIVRAVIIAVLLRNMAIKLLLFILSFVIKKNSRYYFFSSVGNYNFPLFRDEKDFQFKESPKYLAIYCAKKISGARPFFHVPDRGMFDEVRSAGLEPVKGLKAFWYMLRSLYLFVDNNNFFNPNASFLVGRFNIIQCFHGTPLKNIFENAGNRPSFIERLKFSEKKKFRYVLSACPHTTEVFKKLFGTENVVETGYPRNDLFFNPAFFMGGKSLPVSTGGGRRIFLYAPTYRSLEKCVNPFDADFYRLLNSSLSRTRGLFLIKQHPYSSPIKGLEGLSNVIDVSAGSGDVQELLLAADVLITDYSSLIFDFALMKRPIVLFPYDLEYYRQKPGFHLDYERELNLPVVQNPDGLLSLIEYPGALFSTECIEAVENFAKKFNTHMDGSSCERVFKMILEDSNGK